jgi:tetratricopeptide (TPR) repeat protein
MAIIEGTFGFEHPKVGLYLTNIADVYRKQGLFDQADAEYRRALAILEAVYGPNHIEVAEILNAFVCVLLSWQVLPEPPLMLSSLLMGRMGMVYKKRAMYDEAEPLYERALRIVEKTLGHSHPKVGVFLNNIADLHRKRKNYQAAYPLYRKALTIIQNALGKHHSECADVLFVLVSSSASSSSPSAYYCPRLTHVIRFLQIEITWDLCSMRLATIAMPCPCTRRQSRLW